MDPTVPPSPHQTRFLKNREKEPATLLALVKTDPAVPLPELSERRWPLSNSLVSQLPHRRGAMFHGSGLAE